MFNMNFHTSLAIVSPTLGGRASRRPSDVTSWRLAPSASLFSTEQGSSLGRRSTPERPRSATRCSIFATIQTDDVVDSLLALNQTYHKWSVKLTTRRRGAPLQGKLTAMAHSLLELNQSFLDASPQAQGVPLLGSNESRLREMNAQYTQQHQQTMTQPGVALASAPPLLQALLQLNQVHTQQMAVNSRPRGVALAGSTLSTLRKLNSAYVDHTKHSKATMPAPLKIYAMSSTVLESSSLDKLLASRLVQLNKVYVATVEAGQATPAVPLQGASQTVTSLATLNQQ